MKALDEQNLIFLLSMPRAGSTLLQRGLLVGGNITSPAEPWLVLTHMFVRQSTGACAVYGHETGAAAVSDFVSSMPNGDADYDSMLREFILRCYGAATGDETDYFVDKTPRNALVIRDIVRVFPNSKYLFLWRNPLSIVSSMIETFDGGRWNIDRWNADLFVGLPGLIEASQLNLFHKTVVNYELLVSHPLETLQRVSQELDLKLNLSQASLDNINRVVPQGRMGDPTGINEYQTISTNSVSKWVNSLASPIRVRWLRKYLKWLGDERLGLMGYSLTKLNEELDAIKYDPAVTLKDVAWRPVLKAVTVFGGRYLVRRARHSRSIPAVADIY